MNRTTKHHTHILCVLTSIVGFCWLLSLGQGALRADQPPRIFQRQNLIAWCIVPFDAKKRSPEERAAMLKRLGFTHFAYDWRDEHVPTFDAELAALKRQGIRLDAFWFPADFGPTARRILDFLERNHVHTQLWITMGDPAPKAKNQAERVAAAVRILRPIAEKASKIGCRVELYNHGGWFGEPDNQLAIIQELGLKNVGIVYNLHHGHDHLPRFPELLRKMLPHLDALNLNGMVVDGERKGKKILPLGQGDQDLEVLKTIVASGFRGPIGILGHTMDDAEDRLRDNLDGLDWLLPQLEGKPAGPKPKPRTPVPPASTPAPGFAYSKELVQSLIAEASKRGDARHGAVIFRSPQFACLSCHKVGSQGGSVGPELSSVAKCLSQEQIVEAVLWPKREVKKGFMAVSVTTTNGRVHQGYIDREDAREVVLRDPASGTQVHLPKTMIEEQRDIGTLMPEGLAEAMSSEQRRDLLRFLFNLGRQENVSADALLGHAHTASSFPFDSAPLEPEAWPNRTHPVNQDRLYDFYRKEAIFFQKQPSLPALLPEFPGLDGPRHGHWGNQNEQTWADDRWNATDLGNLQAGIFRGAGVTVPRGVCARLGEQGEMSVCFNPETLCYEALWQGGFVRFSSVRHGFMDGLIMAGTALPRPPGRMPDKPFVYHGYYRYGKRVVFAYRVGEEELLDAPWVEKGQFVRQVAPAQSHPLAHVSRGGPMQWPQVFDVRSTLGRGGAYVVDTIPLPVQNPWNALLFCGDHDFYPDGTALVCTMQGDVWRAEGLDRGLEHVRWRRFASGLHHALGLVIHDKKVYVLGRDQITCLHDVNGDGEADYYECFSNAYETSPAGHDFICGLQRDKQGRFYTASGNQGLVRISADGRKMEVLATGFRNPDGLGLLSDGSITMPCSEGEWTPASMICEIHPNRLLSVKDPPSYGYRGPKNGRPPELPMVYIPRGLDNSSGAQVSIDNDRWGPLRGLAVHLSYGAARHFLLLRDEVDGQPQGAVVPVPGDFLSGIHRGRFNPADGQLYVSGMGGWGSYNVADGCFQRVRYTGGRIQLPVACRAYQNGVLLTFTEAIDPGVAGVVHNHFVQAWNYRYGAAYGSPEFSPKHRGTPGHDPLVVASAHVLPDQKSLFLELPDLQPVNQLHLHLHVDAGPALDVFATIHKMRPPFADFPGYHRQDKVIAAHPLLADLAATAKAVPNPYRQNIRGARLVVMEAGKNLSFATRSFTVRAGEPIRLSFRNPDVVPHNWVLVQPGALDKVGDLVNRLIADPEAAARQYVPASDLVLAYTDIVPAGESFSITFRAPKEKGRYPYLCTFPGHWMVMNGVMIVE